MLKQKHVKGNLCGNFTFWATKTLPKWTRTYFNGGMELKVCFVTSLLSWPSLRSCVDESFVGKVLDLNTNLFYLGNGRGVRLLFGGHYSLVFRCFLSNCRLATFHSEVKNRRFLDYKLTKLERGSQQTPYYKILFEKSSVKCFTQTRECFEGMKHSLLIFTSHSLLIFGSWENLKVLTFVLEWFSSEVHRELETKTISNSPHFLSSPIVTSQVFFRQLSDNFLTALRLGGIKSSDFSIPISPQCFVQFGWNFRICLFYA